MEISNKIGSMDCVHIYKIWVSNLCSALTLSLIACSFYCCCRRACLKRSGEQDSYSGSIVGQDRTGGNIRSNLFTSGITSNDQQSLIQPKSILKQGESSRFSTGTHRSLAESSHSAVSQVTALERRQRLGLLVDNKNYPFSPKSHPSFIRLGDKNI